VTNCASTCAPELLAGGFLVLSEESDISESFTLLSLADFCLFIVTGS
jgi:hypothetical protein